MDASEEKQAFHRGIANFCSANGARELAVPMSKFAEYKDAFELSPEAFAKGFGNIVKKAFDEDDYPRRKSLLRKILPWLVIPASIYGASKLGEMWGRHADATGNQRGPISGPLHALMEAMAGKKLMYVGRDAARALGSDAKSVPLTARQHELLNTTGSTVDPRYFG